MKLSLIRSDSTCLVRNKVRHNAIARQKGAGTLVFTLLIGLAVTATSAGVMHSVRGTQVKSSAINAVTHSQTGAWVGAEAFRLYLSELDETGLNAMSNSLTIGMDTSYGAIEAKAIDVLDVGNGKYQVSAHIVNTHAVARASTALSVTYEVEPQDTPAPSNTTFPSNSINFGDSLVLRGEIDLIGPDGNPFDLSVNGDVTLDGISITPLGSINANGKVTINSDVTARDIFANDDVLLVNTKVETVSTLGDFRATQSASVNLLRANGDVTITSSGRFEDVFSLKNVDIQRSGNDIGHGDINAGETITVSNASPLDTLEAVGNITLNTDWTRVGEVVSMQDVTCPRDNWQLFTSVSANGSLNNCGNFANLQSGASNIVTPMTPLEPFVQDPFTVDVWSLRDAANYIISYDSNEELIRVTVNNINGIPNGTDYFVGRYNGQSFVDYLCTAVDSTGNCLEPTDPLIPLCIGASLVNTCLRYEAGNDLFSFDSSLTAPGIMWVEGNLNLGSGLGITTYLASGDITTRGVHETQSVNFGGYDKVCLANADHIGDSADDARRARYTAEYSAHYPTNLCDIDNGLYTPVASGNIALAAGGIDPDGDGTFSGGNIDLGAGSEITGAVLAGNLLKTGGETVIRGIVGAAGSGDSEEGNLLNARTIIDLRSAVDTFSTTTIPNMSGGGGGGGSSTERTNARRLWARYL